MYILWTVAANIDNENMNTYHDAIQNLLDKEHAIKELTAELALKRDTLGKGLQRACDAEQKQFEGRQQSSYEQFQGHHVFH